MADKLEEIYTEYVAAMDEYNQAIISLDASMNLLKSAERKLSKAFDEFTQYMGAQPPYDADPDKHGGDPFSFFNKITRGSSIFDDFGGLL